MSKTIVLDFQPFHGPPLNLSPGDLAMLQGLYGVREAHDRCEEAVRTGRSPFDVETGSRIDSEVDYHGFGW